MRFEPGMTIIVTGASSGIGRAFALHMAGEGARLVLNARSAGPLEAAAEECRGRGAAALAVAGSIADPDVAAEAAAKAAGLSNVYGFVHAAGVLKAGPALWELSPADFSEVMDASVDGGWQLVRNVVPLLRSQGRGVCVFLGSGAAEMAISGIAAYCMAKAAEESLARNLAAEAPELVSLVFRPGVVDTRMQREAREAQGSMASSLRPHFEEYKARGELLRPEEAASALAILLMTDPARYRGSIARATAILDRR